MRNRRAIFSVLATSVILAVASLACEEDKPSEFDEPKADGGEVPDRIQGFDFDGADKPETAAPVDCQPGLSANFVPPAWTPPVTQDVCTDAEIKAYFDACLDQTKGRVLTSPECNTFRAATTTCVSCIEAEKSGPVLAFRDRSYYTENYPACIATIQLQKGGTDACGKAYYQYEECRRLSCDSCFDVKGSTFKDFEDCKKLADDKGPCKDLNTARGQNCDDKKYKDPDGGAPECFTTAGARAFFENAIKIACGSQ